MNDVAGDASDETHRRTLLTARVAAAPTLAEGVSHEVHNPLNCALLQLAVLQRRLEQPDCRPETLQPVAELVEQALRRLELLLNDFLSFVRPRADGRAPLSAGDRCPGVVTLVRADLDEANLRVALELVLELSPADARLSLLLAKLWPGRVETASGASKIAPTFPRREPAP